MRYGAVLITEDLKEKLEEGFECALLRGDNFTNEDQIVRELHPITMKTFFDNLKKSVKEYYAVQQ